jgi:hypothetical protein
LPFGASTRRPDNDKAKSFAATGSRIDQRRNSTREHGQQWVARRRGAYAIQNPGAPAPEVKHRPSAARRPLTKSGVQHHRLRVGRFRRSDGIPHLITRRVEDTVGNSHSRPFDHPAGVPHGKPAKSPGSNGARSSDRIRCCR